jgi:uncharacterized membrane protein
MKPLFVLLAACGICLAATKIFLGEPAWAMSARIAMSAMLFFTAIAHFAFTQGMIMMLPPAIPYKKAVVHFTGILEIAAAIGLFIPGLRTITAWLLMAFFVLILPANIYAASRQVNYQKATSDGKGLRYLWFRIPLQIFFIIWTYLSTLIR